MLSNTAASIPRAGIMFASTGDADRPFPCLPDINGEHGTPGAHEHLSYSFPIEDFPGWMLVSEDPTRLAYFDDDREAMDLSNWEVIKGAVGDYATEVNYGAAPGMQAEYWARNVRDAHDEGAFIVDRVLLVAPIVSLDEDDEHRTRVEELARLANSLEGYPLLDEEDYFEREHEAWCEWAGRGGLQSDTIGNMRDAGWPDPLVEAIDEAWSTVWPIASQYLDEQRGFYGECSPNFHEAIRRAIDAGELADILPAIDEAPTSDTSA